MNAATLTRLFYLRTACTVEKSRLAPGKTPQVFYPLTLKEAERSGINENSIVVMLGCGATPYTSLTLLESTTPPKRVISVDIDEDALGKAKLLMHQRGFQGPQADFLLTDGKSFDFSSQKEAPTHVIVAAMVPNKAAVLEALCNVLPSGTKIIVRGALRSKLLPSHNVTSLKSKLVSSAGRLLRSPIAHFLYETTPTNTPYLEAVGHIKKGPYSLVESTVFEVCK